MADNFTKQQFRFHMGFISIFRKSLLITTSWMFNQRRAFFAKCTLKTFFAKCTLKCLPFFMNWCHVFLHVSMRRKAFITHLHLSFPSWTDVTFYSLMDWCYMFLHISLFRKKLLSHVSHLNDFIPSWIYGICSFILDFFKKKFCHMFHIRMPYFLHELIT